MKKARRILLTAVGLLLSVCLYAQEVKHVVRQGETVSAIARKYDLSVNDILQANPSIGTGDKIIPGQMLNIPSKQHAKPNTTVSTTAAANHTTTQTTQPVAPARQTVQTAATTPQPTRLGSYKEMYRIQKKDNLTKIAREYGLTIEELVEANPGLTVDSKLKKDEFLFIPYSRAEKEAEAARLAAAEAERRAEAERAAAAAKQSTKKKLNVAVVLPLTEGGDRGNKMIEFYRGLLMAADSIKQQGVTINMYAYHSGSTEEDIRFLTSKAEMKSMDVIFGPLVAAQAGTLSKFCKDNKIRLVMPFSTTNSYGQDNPYVYQASASSDVARKTGADLVVSRFQNNPNYVILQTGTADNRGTGFINEVKKELTAKNIATKNLLIEGDDYAYCNAMNQYMTNVIIPDASSLSATRSVVQKLRAFQTQHPEYKISLVGYPEWPTYASTLQNDFYALDTYAYSTFYRDANDYKVVQFEGKYARNFNTEVSHTFPRYGLFGFDLGYYFMNGLSKFGDYFDENTPNVHALQNPLQFKQKNENTAHTNGKVCLIHYSIGQRVDVIK